MTKRQASKCHPSRVDEPDNPEECCRFVETARKLGADESPGAMDRAFERVVKPKKKPTQKQPDKATD